ncbi:SRPBCC domain-containing protein [Bradyrhizobium sp. Tv2a-2]|uniref:SRPBCC family protein n=1 Tax=Bradyrhizobium sp. Tv2a-2 TaxID=113395 RepID=UPI0012EB41E6|nr:SRPBCC domain-containing protein [Bradyrhizobium sp. Tv2a-2]
MAAASGIADPIARPSLTFKRRINAPPERVFAAWTDPKKIVGWFGRPDARAETLQAEADVRVGGRFRFSFSTANEYYEVGGVYREVVPNRRLVFSWAWHSTPERESQVTVALQPDSNGTLLTLHHEQLFDPAARDGHERGWTVGLERMEKLLA